MQIFWIRLILLSLAMISASLFSKEVFAKEESAQEVSAQEISAQEMSAKDNTVRTRNEAVDVKTRALADIAQEVERAASALVVSDNNAMLKAEITAVVEQVKVKVGDQIAKGEALVALDCTDYVLGQELAEADLASSEASLSFAELQYQRALDLKKKSLTSTLDVDSRSTELSQARANRQRSIVMLKQAKRDVQRCEITAPFSGVITEKSASVGELVNPGVTLIHLIDIDSIELSASVNPQYIGQVTDLAKYEFVAQAGGERTQFPVNLARVVAVVDSTQRSSEVRFVFEDNNPPVGTSGKLLWKSGMRLLPQRYLKQYQGRDGAFVVASGKVDFLFVEQARAGMPVEVDWPANTRVIVSNTQSLAVGQRVN